ncbi:MAG: hypothetical protein AB7P52_14895 [Alphaproteobacteria bacterium]
MLAEARSIPEALRYSDLGFSAETLLDAIDGIAYLVDPTGVILATSTKLSHACAHAADGSAQSGEEALATALAVGALDDQVRDAYRRLHDAVCAGQRERISFVHRCDSPEVARVARMSISPVRVGGRLCAVLYQSQVLSEARRPRIALFDHANFQRGQGASFARPVVRLCAYCHAVAWPPGTHEDGERWSTPEAYQAMGGPAAVKLRFAVCPSCLESIIEANTRPD